jgi:hypothetical protein
VSLVLVDGLLVDGADGCGAGLVEGKAAAIESAKSNDLVRITRAVSEAGSAMAVSERQLWNA